MLDRLADELLTARLFERPSEDFVFGLLWDNAHPSDVFKDDVARVYPHAGDIERTSKSTAFDDLIHKGLRASSGARGDTLWVKKKTVASELLQAYTRGAKSPNRKLFAESS